MTDLPVFAAKKILITSGIDFFGSNLTQRLVNEGAVFKQQT
jgi:nucleoside-diphosphate-sugar epimerase